jgi:transposase
MLSLLGERMQPDLEPAPEPDRETLALLNCRRDQLVAMRQQERVRSKECPDPAIAQNLAAHIQWLDQNVAALDQAIAALIAASPGLAADSRLMRSVPGIGPVATATVLALVPELGRRSPKTLAALGGLAPFNLDSGLFRGQRAIRGGRKRVRDALYMAAVSASRSKTRFGAFYRALRQVGKAPKVAFVALARKILTVLNAVIRDRTPFRA